VDGNRKAERDLDCHWMHSSLEVNRESCDRLMVNFGMADVIEGQYEEMRWREN
jgi:hypothetical protein